MAWGCGGSKVEIKATGKTSNRGGGGAGTTFLVRIQKRGRERAYLCAVNQANVYLLLIPREGLLEEL